MKLRLYRLAGLMPVVAQTTDPAQAWPPAASVPALQERMKSIRAETNPERRMALMEEQVKALEAASQGTPAGCPMMGGQMGAGPMMKGSGPGPGAGPMGGMMMDPKLMQEHMKMMQEHMGMMQNMMKMHPAAKPAMPN